MPKYLDEDGLNVLWERIKLLVRDCGGSGGGGGDCSCTAMTNAEIDAVTPITCCERLDAEDFVLEFTETASGR